MSVAWQFVMLYGAVAFMAAAMLGIGGFEDVKIGAEGRFVLVIFAALVWPLLVAVMVLRAVAFVVSGVVQVWQLAFPKSRLPRAKVHRK